jgi:hypothetical protein
MRCGASGKGKPLKVMKSKGKTEVVRVYSNYLPLGVGKEAKRATLVEGYFKKVRKANAGTSELIDSGVKSPYLIDYVQEANVAQRELVLGPARSPTHRRSLPGLVGPQAATSAFVGGSAVSDPKTVCLTPEIESICVLLCR